MNEKTILFQYNVDMDGNPVSVKLKDESQVSTLKHNIQLEQLPDEQYGVVVLDASGKSMKEVYNYDDLENKPNAYYVNYTTGIVHFNPSQSAERKIINYYGTGVELISAKRVFDGYYKASGEYIYKTLQEIIDAGREAIEAMSTIGDVSIILQNLSDKIAEGNIVAEELTNLKQEIAQAINVTGNEVVIINAGDWVYNPTNKMYEYTINHTMNSKDLIIDCYNLATGDFVLCGGKIVNNNSVLIKSETNIDLKVVLNARYYKATLTISDDIAREVVEARKGHETVGKRLDNFDSQLADKVNNYHIRSSSDNPNSNTTNLCFGSIHNMIADDLEGCVISGGGTGELWGNVIGGNCDAVWQGDSSVEKQPNVIDGKPTLGTNAKMSVITGGYDNVCNGLASMITGHHNYIREKATHAVISGGTYNKLDAGNYTGIGGGVNNRITGETSSEALKSSVYSYICGGLDNTINNSSNCFIGSGQRCTIENKNHMSIITGGGNNVIKNTNGYNQSGNFIGGGSNNVIDNSSGSVICGGVGNSIDGKESIIIGGSYNKAMCSNATVFGKETIATRNGEIIYSNGKFTEVGDNNVSQFTLKETTTDGNYKILLASLKDNTSVSYTIKLHATNINDLTETCWFEIKGVVVKQNGTVTRVGTDVITKYGGAIKDTWNTYGLASNQGLLIRIIGEDGKTIRWLAKYEFTEISV